MPQLVAIDLPGGEAFLHALQRIWDAGDSVLPLDQRLTPRAKQRVLDAMGASAVLDGTGRTRLPGGEPVEEGDALVMATSGTTGDPKGVVLTHAAIEASARATSARLGVDPDRHRWLACLPLNHIGGFSVVAKALCTGTPLTLLAGFDAGTVEAAAGPDVLVSLVATALLRTPAHLFHTVVLGGSSPPERLAANVVTTYGLTETGSGVVYDGIPLDGVEVAISGAGGRPASGGGSETAGSQPVSGEVLVRGPMLLRAYRDGRVPLDREGWFRTGDAGAVVGGRLGAGGRLVVAGRMGDMIVTGGENVWPAPVENAIGLHPSVAEVAVAGRPDPEWGQRVVAWIVAKDGTRPPALEELRDLVGEHLPRYASPRQLVVVGSLPRTALGKVRRDALPLPLSGPPERVQLGSTGDAKGHPRGS